MTLPFIIKVINPVTIGHTFDTRRDQTDWPEIDSPRKTMLSRLTPRRADPLLDVLRPVFAPLHWLTYALP